MELTSSPVYRTDKTGQICNGLQALLMTTGQAVRRGAQQRHLQLRGNLALWPAAGMKTGAGHWTWVIGGQLPLLLSTTSQQSLLSCLRSQLLLLLCGYLRLAHGRQPATAVAAIVPAALPSLSPLVASQLASNSWSVQQNQNPSRSPDQLVVLRSRQSHGWSLQMQLN